MKFQNFEYFALFLSSSLVGAVTTTNPFATYPQVPKTASINGFADPIYSKLPSCAQSCVKQSTSNTPCPYWDTGCLCVMPQFDGPIGECIAERCKGKDVKVATNLANALCTSVGAPLWAIPASVSSELNSAATAT